jgi:phosphoglycolate phosphatase-like HAD superfamily hydrolase
MYVCLFDIDGTLINTSGAGRDALRHAMASAFGIHNAADVYLHGRTDRGISEELFMAHGIEPNENSWTRFRAAYLQILPDTLRTRPGRICPGIVELLESLRRRTDVAVGLLTGNSRHGARIKLQHFDLWRYFDFGAFGDDHPLRDDVARSAVGIIERHRGESVPSDRIWIIGDTPADVQCARAIHARALAVTTGDHRWDELAAANPDHLARDLTDHAALHSLWPAAWDDKL